MSARFQPGDRVRLKPQYRVRNQPRQATVLTVQPHEDGLADLMAVKEDGKPIRRVVNAEEWEHIK